jgi:hypothetical protein
VNIVSHSTPHDHGLPGRGWTLKKLQRWVATHLGRRISRSALRTILHSAGLSWKRSKKLLAKATPAARAGFVEQFQTFSERCAVAKWSWFMSTKSISIKTWKSAIPWLQSWPQSY